VEEGLDKGRKKYLIFYLVEMTGKIIFVIPKAKEYPSGDVYNTKDPPTPRLRRAKVL
jgi:hypothetical protein